MSSPDRETRPIFILGNPRSGTSLLGRMLNCHARIGLPYEAHIYNVFWPVHDRYEPLTDPRRQRALARDMLAMRAGRYWNNAPDLDAVMARVKRPDFHGVFEALISAWAQGQGKPRWGEKTPQNGPYWRAISQGFPDAQFIHLVRDGRDCALSWIDARFGPKRVYPAAVKWASYIDHMRQMRDTLGPGRVYEVHYEDLINKPQQILRALCGFLGEAYDPQMLAFYKRDDTYMTERRNNQKLKQPIMSDNAEKWKARMSPNSQRIFEAVAGEQLQLYGYPLVHPDATVSSWEAFRDTWMLHPPLRALSMIRNTKGWLDSLVGVRAKARLLLTTHRRPHAVKEHSRQPAKG